MAKILLYLAYKHAVATSAPAITAEVLDKIDELRVEPEDLERIETIAGDPRSRRIRRRFALRLFRVHQYQQLRRAEEYQHLNFPRLVELI